MEIIMNNLKRIHKPTLFLFFLLQTILIFSARYIVGLSLFYTGTGTLIIAIWTGIILTKLSSKPVDKT